MLEDILFNGIYKMIMEEKMRKFIVFMTVVMMVTCVAAITWAEPKDECITLCKRAAEIIKKDGLDKGIQAINDKKGKFVTENTYVFLMDMDAKMLAHPMNPKLLEEGPLIKTADTAGKKFFAEFVKVANDPGEGWVSYMWPKPGEEKPSAKNSYIYRVPGTQYFVGAGIYK